MKLGDKKDSKHSNLFKDTPNVSYDTVLIHNNMPGDIMPIASMERGRSTESVTKTQSSTPGYLNNPMGTVIRYVSNKDIINTNNNKESTPGYIKTIKVRRLQSLETRGLNDENNNYNNNNNSNDEYNMFDNCKLEPQMSADSELPDLPPPNDIIGNDINNDKYRTVIVKPDEMERYKKVYANNNVYSDKSDYRVSVSHGLFFCTFFYVSM